MTQSTKREILEAAQAALGIARAALSESIEYARGREVFGQPVARYQAVAHRLAAVASSIECASLLLEDARSARGEAGALLALHAAADAATGTADTGMEILGAAGFDTARGMHRHYLDARQQRFRVDAQAACAALLSCDA